MKPLIIALLFLVSSVAYPADLIRLKPGTLSVFSYIEMMSNQLKLVVNASDIQDRHVSDVEVSAAQLSWDEAYNQLLSVLYLRDLSIIHNAALDTYQVMGARDARDREMPVITDPSKIPKNDQLITAYFRLKYTFSEAVARNMRSFMPANSRIIPFFDHLVLVTDVASSMPKVQALVEGMDTEKGAQDYKEDLKHRKKPDPCPESPTNKTAEHDFVFFGLVALVGILLGFVIRGYVIRRIEGGL